MRTIFTTGQVAKICKVAPRTVSKWFDSGRLRGYRIPGSQDRRIPREHLIRFLNEHGFDGILDNLEPFALVVGLGEVEVEGFKVVTADSAFAAGIEMESLRPDRVIVNEDIPGCRDLRLWVENNLPDVKCELIPNLRQVKN